MLSNGAWRSVATVLALAVLLAGCSAPSDMGEPRSRSRSVAGPPDPLSPPHREAEQGFPARVVRVTDGDTLVATLSNQEVTIRLAEIDAPERGQPWGDRSRRQLLALVGGATIFIVPTDTDRWGRTIALVYVDGVNVNERMVTDGGAWAFLRYQRDPHFSELEQSARSRRVGLWRLHQNETVPPWDWRAGVRPAQGQTLIATRDEQNSFTCGTRQFCSQMTSCAEARFHLEQCSVGTIDGDGDGTPCETLCAGG